VQVKPNEDVKFDAGDETAVIEIESGRRGVVVSSDFDLWMSPMAITGVT